MAKLLLEDVQFTDEKLIKNNYNALELSVNYQKGGYNWATGDKEDGGIYVYLQPMSVTQNSTSYMLFDDSAYKIQVQEYKNLILDLFIENRRQDILNLIKSFAV